MSTYRLDAAHTFDLAHSLGGVPSDAPVDSTLHRRLVSLDPHSDGLPSFSPDGAHALVEGDLLGEGGMGQVHEAHDPVLARTVAMKRARPAAGTRARASLVAEARTLASLDHPNIVPVHSLGRGPDGAPILVMKKVSGEAWSAMVRAGRDLDRDLRIFLAICDALRFAHARGLLHRDLKPDNVMVGTFGEVYLMDWGCACPAEDATTEEIVGTPQFMAPEMVRSGCSLGPTTDVFLLGATLHRAVTGHPLYGGVGLREVLQQAWEARPVAYGEEVPAELAQILHRACARDPADRFATVDALADAVRAMRDHRAAQALATAASSSLPELEAALQGSPGRADALFAEVRFGYRAARQIWPECPEARFGQAHLLEVWLPWKLARGEISAVESLLPELEPPQVATWQRRIAEARQLQDRRESERQAFDLHVAAQERRSVGLSSLVLVAALVVVVALAEPEGGVDLPTLAWLSVLTLGVVVLGMLPFRRRLLATRASQALMLGLVLMLSASTVNRFVSLWAALPVPSVLFTDCLIFTLSLTLLAMTTERWLVLACVPVLLAMPALLAYPDLATRIYPVAGVAAMGVSLIAFARRAQEAEEGTAPEPTRAR